MVKKQTFSLKNLLRLVCCFLGLLFGFSLPSQANDSHIIRIATSGDYPPFTYIDSNGQVQGFEIDLARAFCAEMRVTCEFFVQDWSGLIPALVAGKYDALLASISITEDRKKEVSFSDPIYTIPMGIVTTKNSSIKGVDPQDFDGKRIGVQASTVHSAYAEDVYEPAGASIKLYRTLDEASSDLKSGRLDALLADSFVLDLWLKKDGSDCCRDLGRVANTQYFGEGAGIAFRKEDVHLRNLFNKAIVLSRKNGTYQKISQDYFGRDVYKSEK